MSDDPQSLPPEAAAFTYLKLVAVSAIWGGTFVAGRFLAGEAPPLLSASIRFLMASVVLLAFLVLTGKPFVRPTASQGLRILLLGFFGIFLYNLCFFYGLQHVDASRASLIVALNPAAIALVSFLLHKERLSASRLSGIALCVAGAGLVIAGREGVLLHGGARAWLGDLLIFGCVVSWVIYSVFSRGVSSAIGPLHAVTYSILAGTLMLGVTTAGLGQVTASALAGIGWPQLSSLLYLGVAGSAVAYILYYDGIRRIGATRSGVFIALNPVTAVLAGALLLGERLTTVSAAGGLLVGVSIFLCNRPVRAGG